MKGKIAFIKRGTCEFGLKVAYAGASGAAGAIIFNNADGTISGTLSGPSRPEGPYVGVGGISGEDGEVIRVLIAAGQEVIGTLKAAAESKTLWSNNVIATTKRGDQNNIVFSGAHSDSVPAGPVRDVLLFREITDISFRVSTMMVLVPLPLSSLPSALLAPATS